MSSTPIIIGKDYIREPVREPCADTGRRVVVTGASGMLGSYLTAALLEAGYRNITVLLRSLSGLSRIRMVWQAEGYPWDVTLLDVERFDPGDGAAVAGVFAGADTVFNCAAAVTIGGMDRGQIIETNTRLARTVAEAALEARCRLLVHVSSVAALSPSPAGIVGNDAVAGCGPHPSPYAESKYLSELEIAVAARKGLRTITVNPVTILGFGDPSHGSAAIIPVISRGMPFYTRGMTGWVDARDVARAMVKLSECADAPGRRFVLCGCNVTYRDLMTQSCRCAGRPIPRIALPHSVAKAAARASELYARLTGSGGKLTPELVSILYENHRYDGDDIKNYINFDYSPLNETLRRLVRIYRVADGETVGG